MPLPFHLEKLPPEALDIIRFMDKTPSANPAAIEKGTGISARAIGKAIRRLVNFDYIQMGSGGAYALTTDGKAAAHDLAVYDAAGPTAAVVQEAVYLKRRFTVVMPRALNAGKASDIYVGVNPPVAGDEQLPGIAHLDIKVTAIGATLGANHVSLEIPPDIAARPGKVTLTPGGSIPHVRLRFDIFQTFELDSAEPLEKIYFDVPVETAPTAGNMAKGVDLMLRPPRL
jgi:hypothetical protein